VKRFGVSGSVGAMKAAVASLCDKVTAEAPELAQRAELVAWTERQRAVRERVTAARKAAVVTPPLVSSSAPRTALEAWRERQRQRFDRRA